MVGVRYMIYHWAINRTDPQNLLSTTLDVLLQSSHMFSEREYFISYTEANNGQLVTVGGLNHIPVVGHRSVFF